MKDWKTKLRETDWFYTLESEDGMDSAVGLDFEYLEWFIEQLLSQAVQEAKDRAVLDYILSLGWQDIDNEYVKEVLEDADRIASKLNK